jgi:hypothetical protein
MSANEKSDPVLTSRAEPPEAMNCPYCDAKWPAVEFVEVPKVHRIMYMCNQCGKNWSCPSR